MEVLSVLFALVGIVLVIGTFCEMFAKGSNKFSLQDAILGFGIGGGLLIIAMLLD